MRKITKPLSVLLFSSFFLLGVACNPNGDKNSTDDEYYKNGNSVDTLPMQGGGSGVTDTTFHSDSLNMNK